MVDPFNFFAAGDDAKIYRLTMAVRADIIAVLIEKGPVVRDRKSVV